MVKRSLGQIHEKILALLKAHPGGISAGEMRAPLGIKPEEQVQFGRRRRDLHYYYKIEKKRIGPKTVYILKGLLDQPRDLTAVGGKTRASVLRNAHGRCGMCGRSIEKHNIVLVVDHRIPRDWGGSNEPENLWAICEECNHGKKNLFSSVNSAAVRAAINNESVHVRIGELLKATAMREPVPSYLLQFVADQDDWHKRLRELRYLGWKITSTRKRLSNGRVQSAYKLEKFTDWPANPTQWIRNYEQQRARRNNAK